MRFRLLKQKRASIKRSSLDTLTPSDIKQITKKRHLVKEFIPKFGIK